MWCDILCLQVHPRPSPVLDVSLLKWFVVFWAVMTPTLLWKRPQIQSPSGREAVKTSINNSYLDHYGMKNDLGNARSGGREEARKITTGLMDGHPCALFHPCSPVAGNFGGVSPNANMEESCCWDSNRVSVQTNKQLHSWLCLKLLAWGRLNICQTSREHIWVTSWDFFFLPGSLIYPGITTVFDWSTTQTICPTFAAPALSLIAQWAQRWKPLTCLGGGSIGIHFLEAKRITEKQLKTFPQGPNKAKWVAVIVAIFQLCGSLLSSHRGV